MSSVNAADRDEMYDAVRVTGKEWKNIAYSLECKNLKTVKTEAQLAQIDTNTQETKAVFLK